MVAERRIEALQRLAERPGTEAEGELARSFLETLARKHKVRVPERFVSEEDLRRKFPKGAQVYYNMWCYEPNAPGIVTCYDKERGWIRIKFDHLKSSRSVPIYTERGGCHLSTEPLPLIDAYDLIYIHIPQWRDQVLWIIEMIGLDNISFERRQAMIDEYGKIPGMDAVLRALGMVSGYLENGVTA